VGVDAQSQSLSTIRPQASFGVGRVGDDVVLTYVAVPEPTMWLLGAASLAAAAIGRFGRRRHSRGRNSKPGWLR
jgi:hypothetical protein